MKIFLLAALLITIAATPAWADADSFHRQNLAACRANPQMAPQCSCIEDQLRSMGVNDFSGTLPQRQAKYDSAVWACNGGMAAAAGQQNGVAAQNNRSPNKFLANNVQWNVTVNDFTGGGNQIMPVAVAPVPGAVTFFTVGTAGCSLGPSQTQQNGGNVYVIKPVACKGGTVSNADGGTPMIVCTPQTQGNQQLKVVGADGTEFGWITAGCSFGGQ